MRGETILDVIRSRARDAPEKVALVYAASGRTVTYRELIEKARAWAGFFARRYPDARPLLTLPNDEPAVEALLGALAAGAAPVLADPALTPRERAALTRNCASRASLRRIPAAPPARLGEPLARPARGGVVLITHTSGTTALPKGIALTHETILARCRAVQRALAGGPSLRALYHMPLAHGSMIPCFYTLYCGGTFVLDAPFSLDRLSSFWRTVADNEITDVHTVPSVVRALLQFPRLRGESARGLRRVTSTGSPLPEGTRERFERCFGVPLLDCYGLKETAYAVVAGRSIVPMAAVDERGRRLPAGRVGVLAMAGPTVAPGYCRGRALDRSAWRGRWFLTRDLGSVDARGRVRRLGRADDVVITRDLKVWPEEVESALKRHPGVADAAVLGLPDAWRGSRLVACVVAAGRRPSAEALLRHCRRRLSAQKVPTEFRFIDAIPRTTLGKVRRSALGRCFKRGDAL